jgi:hypothetical protein
MDRSAFVERTRPDILPPEREKVKPSEIDCDRPLELAVLAVKASNARCLLPDTQKELTLRSGDLWDVFPGDVVTVRVHKAWSYFRHTYVSGRVEESRLDLKAFGFTPLRLEGLGLWNPREHYWGEEGEPLESWAQPIHDRGPRPEYEMEQIIPGEDSEAPDSDPITEAVDLLRGGAFVDAYELLMDLLQADMRCLDAHAHLGNFRFDHHVTAALRHYKTGVKIGELSLGSKFEALLPWAAIDNRPFLRCLHGYGLCLWRLGRAEEAAEVFNRMLWLNPTDNQGARFLLSEVDSGREWTPEE